MTRHNLTRIDELLKREEVICAGRLNWFEHIDSTNRYLMEQTDIHGLVCLTELQTAGRGRRGRHWHAPPSSSILMSIGWDVGKADVAGLSLVSGLAVIEALSRAGVTGVGLKWPNDLIAGGKKLGGILTELSDNRCVVGMGINVSIPAPESTAISQPWIDIQSLGHVVDRDLLAAYLIVSHCHFLERFGRCGFRRYVHQWNRLNVHHGQPVTIVSPAESYTGVVAGVDGSGALLLDQRGMRRKVVSGEVSLRSGHLH